MGVLNNSSDNRAAPDGNEPVEAVRMLELAIAQIALAMHDGKAAVSTLDQAFTSAANGIAAVADLAVSPEHKRADDEHRRTLVDQCADAQAGVQQSIIALQFYDRLSQRLEHVQNTLNGLSSLLGNPSKANDGQAWLSLRDSIRERYTMREEQALFDAISNGAGVEQALGVALEQEKQRDDDVELF